MINAKYLKDIIPHNETYIGLKLHIHHQICIIIFPYKPVWKQSGRETVFKRCVWCKLNKFLY